MKYSLKLYSILILLLFACNSSTKKNVADYKTTFVSGSTKNKIEVLDFGGSGQTILFLTGLGNSAHVFVDFAPKFRDKFHVYAMTRRGYGASELTTNGYHIDTLANDILAVIKALNIDKAILIGHSIAGDEISKFASSYPDKVEKVIYLDAAHDRTNLMTIYQNLPAFPNPSSTDSSSLDNLTNFIKNTIGVEMPKEEVKNISVFSKEGKYLKDITPSEIQSKIVAGVERPNYTSIKCPALAIYAIGSLNTLFPFYKSLDSVNKKKADTTLIISSKWVHNQIDLFRKEVKKGIVKEIDGANHYVFISHPIETENFIREFLK